MKLLSPQRFCAQWAALACVVLAGCASVGAPPVPFAGPGSAETTEITECVRWFAALDAATDRAHVRDGGAARLPGFPFLRVDRFLSSFRVEASVSATVFSAWGTRLRALDAEAREAELANLPAAALPDLAVPDKAAAQATTRRCANQLWREVEASPPQRAALVERARVPDDYTAWKRAVGLYPLTRLPFFAGVQGWQNRLRETFAQIATQPAPATLRRFGLPPSAPVAPVADAVALVRTAPRDALGVPQFTAAEAQRLLAAHAPVWEIDSRGAFDAFGALYWPAARTPRTPPAVNTAQPVVYARLAFTRVGNEVWPQLVYSLWFPERPLASGVDLLGGPLDAVVLRLTLAPDGAPRMVDTIHACGCYHLFMPVGAAQPRPPPAGGRADEEWAFVPTQLPATRPGQRIAVRLQSATHYVVGLRMLDANAPGVTPALDGHYRLADDDALRQLALPEGGTRSAFGADGIIVGTERGERLLFWPMGIDSPGGMRQWGRQPTAFVGRRHFDEARLVGERFRGPWPPNTFRSPTSSERIEHTWPFEEPK
jgi:hypothetical protein